MVDFSVVIKDNASAQPMIIQTLVTIRNIGDKLQEIHISVRLNSSAT